MMVEQRGDRTDNEPPGFVWVARTLMDRTDRYSVTYISGKEAMDAEYFGLFGPLQDLDNSVYRRSDRNSGIVWVGASFGLPGWTERRTGAVVKEGSSRRAMLTLRYQHPGKVYDTDIPNP